MPPSTSSSVIRSAFFRPTWGTLAELLSILVTSTGRLGVLPVTGSPVHGHNAASCLPPAIGCESGFSLLSSLFLSPPPHPASTRLSTVRNTTATRLVDRRLDPRGGEAGMGDSMTKRAR